MDPPTPTCSHAQSQTEAVLGQHPGAQAWATATKWKGKSGDLLLVPGGPNGGVSRVLLGTEGEGDLWASAALAKLPAGEKRRQREGEGGGPIHAPMAAGSMPGPRLVSLHALGEMHAPLLFDRSSLTADGLPLLCCRHVCPGRLAPAAR